ncbi:MAG TPA: cysteine--tRNA ligase [Desulfobacteraceae bacterium]|nr:cysteine--tRNA ligase [Desulfobacteraceae bacterium]HPJ66932.1 cysteine--tRNA ligase [Desulfobacteraceae bacterium]HPQ29751.1 cysteine--tRNA ligase [Desulfobacteraceae bacterium]
MTLKLYNTATRKKEIFHPIEEGKAGIYVCGVTVYDLCHIGHARSAIVFDVLVRYLRAKGLKVNYVRNFTDVDDKIIERANKLGRETGELAQEYIDAFYEDMGRLNVLNADHEPRATEHIDGMIDMISRLMDRGYAYAEGNDVFFSVEKFKGYGRLSGRKLEDMQAGSRIAVDEKKRHPMDFVLWKGVKPGEPQWPSPWGPGRPGWHIECSVMCNHYLGKSFDIHGGGRDLLFPHHENERAQSIAAMDGDFARYWVHNGFVTVESEKMSKSLGNFLTIRDAIKIYHPEVLRLFLVSRHYRSPLDFSKSAVFDLQSGLVRIYRTLQRLEEIIGPYEENNRPSGFQSADSHDGFAEEFTRVMDDDLNTAGAIGLIFDKVRDINKVMDSIDGVADKPTQSQLADSRHLVYSAAGILGFLQETPSLFFEQLSSSETRLDSEEIEKMIEERAVARANRDWEKSDQIRAVLKDKGIILEDGPKGTIWRLDV